MSYVWPIILVVLSNTLYQICAKSTPAAMSPLASLTITYAVGAIASGVLYFLLTKNANLVKEYSHLNWAPFVMGIVIVGLEVGFIYAYKAGWQVSMASVVQSVFLAITLLIVGVFLYKEPISWNKFLGIAVCMLGIGLVNFK